MTRMDAAKKSVVRFLHKQKRAGYNAAVTKMSYLGRTENHSSRIISVSRYELKRYKICTLRGILTAPDVRLMRACWPAPFSGFPKPEIIPVRQIFRRHNKINRRENALHLIMLPQAAPQSALSPFTSNPISVHKIVCTDFV